MSEHGSTRATGFRPRTIAIVGSGVVGTATGLGLSAVGHEVVFCDVSTERLAVLRGSGYRAVTAEGLTGCTADAYLLSVPTPTVNERVDLTHVGRAARAVGRAIARHPGHPLVAVRSTVPPGTTEDLVIPELEEASGRTAGEGFGVCTNPEFLRAATAAEDFLHPRVIVIGSLDPESEAALRAVYEPWEDVPVVATDLRTAEATKYVANLFNATKISFFNEMHRMLSTIGADPDVAAAAVALGAEACWNPRYGTRGGEPFGGVCLPKDTVGFLGFARERGLARLLPVLAAAVRVNDEMAASRQASAEGSVITGHFGAMTGVGPGSADTGHSNGHRNGNGAGRGNGADGPGHREADAMDLQRGALPL